MKANADMPIPVKDLPPVSEADYYAAGEEDEALRATGVFPQEEGEEEGEGRKIRVRFKKR